MSPASSPSTEVEEVLRYASPIVLLFYFLFAFSAQSIAASKSTEAQKLDVQYGPQGKPLPIRSKSFKKVLPRDFSPNRKLLFEWLTAAVCFTFFCNAVIVIWHALYNRRDHWWAGKAVTASISFLELQKGQMSNMYLRSMLSGLSFPTRSSSFLLWTPYHHPQTHNFQHGVSPFPWSLLCLLWT